jgi:hypothetical protein
MNTKKSILVFGAIGTIYFVALTLLSTTHFCPNNQTCTDLFMRFSPWNLASYIFFTLPFFFLSLITYRMKDEVFRAWWRFARWWVPVIIATTLFLENAGGGGGLGIGSAVQGAFIFLVLAILYAILIITSLVKIVRTL